MLTLVDKRSLISRPLSSADCTRSHLGYFRHRVCCGFSGCIVNINCTAKLVTGAELALGGILSSQTQSDLAGLGVGGALSKPKFVNMAVTPFAENPPHLDYILLALAT